MKKFTYQEYIEYQKEISKKEEKERKEKEEYIKEITQKRVYKRNNTEKSKQST